jgi:hypothetical protein
MMAWNIYKNLYKCRFSMHVHKTCLKKAKKYTHAAVQQNV